MENSKPTKIFITHSSIDEEYVKELTALLRSLKVPNGSIICTSDPRHAIPNSENAYVWLRKQFIEADLHMIFVLSENYYQSNICLNEMGAAWLVAKKSDLLLLPGFSFSDLRNKGGCLDVNIQGVCIDSDDQKLRQWLNNLKNDVIEEFSLERPNDLDWEENRDNFISKMKTIVSENDSNSLNINSYDKKSSDKISTGKIHFDEGLLLIYAADDSKGAIMVTRSVTRSGPIIETKGYDFAKEDTARECARWKAAVESLVDLNLVEDVNHGKCFQVTNDGFNVAEMYKTKWNIDTNRPPYEYLEERKRLLQDLYPHTTTC